MSKFVYVLVLCLLFTACEKKENQIQNEENLSTPSINIKKGDANTLKDELWVIFCISSTTTRTPVFLSIFILTKQC